MPPHVEEESPHVAGGVEWEEEVGQPAALDADGVAADFEENGAVSVADDRAGRDEVLHGARNPRPSLGRFPGRVPKPIGTFATLKRPPRVRRLMSWIQVTEPGAAEGRLKDEYEATTKSRGALANIHKAFSLHPGALSANLALYKELHFAESPLSRRDRELIATVVSRVNGCGYCVAHHADAFGRHANEAGLQALIATDYTRAPLSARERAIADHAVLLTRNPGGVTAADVDKLRAHGLDDRAILDVTLEAAYFNFINRVATGLGVSQEDVGGSYKYD